MIDGSELPDIIGADSSREEFWVVQPSPGYVLKFKEVEQSCRTFLTKEKCKLFLNICHCSELPPPLEDLEEDEVVDILDSSDPSRYRIPLGVGDVETILDRKGEDSLKIDVIVNSLFYIARLEKSEFFRQLLLLVVSEAIDEKYGMKIQTKNAIKLKNRKSVGELSSQRIRKKPREAFIKEMESTTNKEILEKQNRSIPRNCMLVLHDGEQLEVKVSLASIKPPVTEIERLSIRMNDDHLMVVLDRKRTVVDVYFPVRVDHEKVVVKLLLEINMLQILAPVIW